MNIVRTVARKKCTQHQTG